MLIGDGGGSDIFKVAGYVLLACITYGDHQLVVIGAWAFWYSGQWMVFNIVMAQVMIKRADGVQGTPFFQN